MPDTGIRASSEFPIEEPIGRRGLSEMLTLDSAMEIAAEGAENAEDADEKGSAVRVGGMVAFTHWGSRPKFPPSAFSASSVSSVFPSYGIGLTAEGTRRAGNLGPTTGRLVGFDLGRVCRIARTSLRAIPPASPIFPADRLSAPHLPASSCRRLPGRAPHCFSNSRSFVGSVTGAWQVKFSHT